MEEGGNDKRVLDLSTKGSQHRNTTVLYMCQDMFPAGKCSKSISRNAHYVISFKQPPWEPLVEQAVTELKKLLRQPRVTEGGDEASETTTPVFAGSFRNPMDKGVGSMSGQCHQ